MGKIDLFDFVSQGGCSAKLPAIELNRALADLPKISHKNLLVSIDTHDDAGVYKISEELALVQTTDFFPPVCSDPYEYGQIAAANALSDVFAMGGTVLTALNLLMFPANLPMEVLKEILRGGQDKVSEAGGIIVGGHTIADETPKYGLAVTGLVHPNQIITNSNSLPGDQLILTKAIGTGTLIAARKNNLITEKEFQPALESMKQLNRQAALIMQKYGVKSATDITGFGLMGHALKMAIGSGVSACIHADKVPRLPLSSEMIELGCIPGASFGNMEYVEADCLFADELSYNDKMLMADAQSSGGILMAVLPQFTLQVIEELKKMGYSHTSIIGEITENIGQALHIKQ